MSWIKYRINLPTDPRVVCIAGIVGLPTLHVCGALLVVWTIGDQHSIDGVLPGYTVAAIDAATGIQGFGQAMRAVGWLEVGAAFVAIPRFHEHNGESAKCRAQGQLRQQRYKSNANTVTKVTPRALPDKTRQDQRRETPSTPRQAASGGGGGAGGEIRDSGWEARKAYWRKKPDWWPGKPWVSARGLDELADLTGAFTDAEVKSVLTDVRRQCAGLTNPAGYLVKAFRTAKAEKGGA